MSFGPRAESGTEPAPDAAAAQVGTWAAQQAFALGRESADREIAGALLDASEAYRAAGSADQELAAYGPGGREHFGDPRPGDFPGRQQQAEQEAEAG